MENKASFNQGPAEWNILQESVRNRDSPFIAKKNVKGLVLS